MPIIEDFEELSTRSYYSFEEMMRCWGRDVRNRRTGECYLRLVDDPTVYDVRVQRSTPGHLGWDVTALRHDLPEVLDDVARLIETNYQSDFFVTPALIEKETTERIDRVLKGHVVLHSEPEPQNHTAQKAVESSRFPG